MQPAELTHRHHSLPRHEGRRRIHFRRLGGHPEISAAPAAVMVAFFCARDRTVAVAYLEMRIQD